MRPIPSPFRNPLRTTKICRRCRLAFSTRLNSSIARKRQIKPPDRTELPRTPARTRFAPSPTGYLHLGSLRTALFNYLLAKATGGQFLLRLEDTDKKRTVPDAEKRLYEDLRWAGLNWHEGPETGGPHGPYRQSERTTLYREHANKLITSGHAYRCFCSSERLASLAEQRSNLGLPTDYDRTCTSIPSAESEDRASRGEAHVIRLKVPDAYPEFNDIVYGLVGRETAPQRHVGDSWEDPILLKSDGLPTYNLANVVDDHHMQITHVVRGTEWMAMTPKHLAMYEAFGWQPPQFAHVGLLTGIDGAKLSKRTGSTDVRSFREQGVLPEALVNFVALLGWSNRKSSDVMSLKELEKNFNLKFTRGSTAINMEKLWFLQTKHVVALASQDDPTARQPVVNHITKALSSQVRGSDTLKEILDGRSIEEYIGLLLQVDAKNYTTPNEFLSRNSIFFEEPSPSPQDSSPFSQQTCIIVNDIILKAIEGAQPLKEAVARAAKAVAEVDGGETSKDSLKDATKLVYVYLRRALTQGKPGVALKETVEILGYRTVKRRLENSIEY